MNRTVFHRGLLALMLAGFDIGSANAQSASALVDQAAKAMGGPAALRAVNNQVVESEGKQFNSSPIAQLGPQRQINTFRYTLTRDLHQPRLRLDWDARTS